MSTQIQSGTENDNVAELLQLLDHSQKASDAASSESLPHPLPPVPPGPANWMIESPEVERSFVQQSFATLNPACRADVLEEFRSLRTRVVLERKSWFDQGADLRAVAVFSAGRRSGKSVVAANLAAVLAATGDNRVLLIDANPASPTMAAHLGLKAQTGLCEVLSGEPWYRQVHRIAPASLFVMPFGSARTNSVDSFDYTIMPFWLNDLRASFDWIIFDGPSFESRSDAQMLANFTDASLIVVRREEARYDGVQVALKRIPREKLLGAVVMPPLKLR
jgi:Mrp family chromosome partitioning ATPase